MLARLITRARAALLRRQHERETRAIARLTDAQTNLQRMQEAVPGEIDTHRNKLTDIERALRRIEAGPHHSLSAEAICRRVERRAKWGGVA